jgi:hypothetical protein
MQTIHERKICGHATEASAAVAWPQRIALLMNVCPEKCNIMKELFVRLLTKFEKQKCYMKG